MNLSQTKINLFLIIILSLIAACNTASPPPTPVEAVEVETEVTNTPTESEPVATKTATLKPTFTLSPSPSPHPTATNTRVPTMTPTSSPTPEPDPMIKVDETLTIAVNIRTGPGTVYPKTVKVEPGHEAFVLGRNEDNSWWQISLADVVEDVEAVGWIFGELVIFSGNQEVVAIVDAPPTPTPEPVVETEADVEAEAENTPENETVEQPPLTSEELADILRCGKDFCVTYQALMPIWENGGCIGNHSIYITVLEGLPPGKPMDGVVIGDTYDNVEVGSGSHGPGRTEITLWNNSMTLYAKRHMDGTPYTSEESFNFTASDELIPAEVLAAAGYCEGRIDVCEHNRNHNSVCRGHYSWRVTFHKFD